MLKVKELLDTLKPTQKIYFFKFDKEDTCLESGENSEVQARLLLGDTNNILSSDVISVDSYSDGFSILIADSEVENFDQTEYLLIQEICLKYLKELETNSLGLKGLGTLKALYQNILNKIGVMLEEMSY